MNKFEWQKWLYYYLIGIISLVTCVFIPMLGSEVDLGFNIPNTIAGWVVYIMTKIIVAVVNIMIFYCFMEQAKTNVKDNENYKKANDILLELEEKVRLPRSPEMWTKKQYLSKGISIFIISVLSAFALTSAILSFDIVQMLTYLFTIIMGLIFGVIQMKYAEQYWTLEYYEYAIYIAKTKNIKENKNDNS